jgi:hypothetical protein
LVAKPFTILFAFHYKDNRRLKHLAHPVQNLPLALPVNPATIAVWTPLEETLRLGANDLVKKVAEDHQRKSVSACSKAALDHTISKRHLPTWRIPPSLVMP